MPTHPLWNPYDPPSDEQIAAAMVDGVPRQEQVHVVSPDESWPEWFAEVRALLAAALGERALAIEHVGSTSVAGLWAKPVVDVDLSVADSGDEPAWLPDLEAAGLVLRVREPEWEEHRCLRLERPRANVHVFSPGAREPARHRMFRDWLLTHEADRAAYGALKVELAGQGFTDVMQYNNAKAGLIYDIYERAFAADAASRHDPQPRPA